jgi:hypothetical protein
MEKTLPVSMILGGSSDEEFKGFNTERMSSKDDLATLSDAPEALSLPPCTTLYCFVTVVQ